MTTSPARIRLFVPAPLENGAIVALGPDAAHHALSVLRLKDGDRVLLFNGRNGEWAGTIEGTGRKSASVHLDKQTREQDTPPDIWLLFAPLKKTATDYTVEKATELGVARMVPVITRRTETRRLNAERLAATATDAAQQSERLDVPEITALRPLEAVLADWDVGRTLFVAAERAHAPTLFNAVRREAGPHAILIGPEGGFEAEELDAVLKLPFAVAVNLGPRILRAETASVAALAIWQAAVGDENQKETP